jgi:hypothetical protein
MIPNEHAAQNTIDGIHDALRSGAPLTPRMQARTHAALRTLRDERGADAANTARCKLRLVALCRAAELMGMKKSTRAARSTPVRSRGVNAEQLGAIHRAWLASMRARGMHP